MHLFHKILDVQICYIVEHPPILVEAQLQGPVFMTQNEVVQDIPCDPGVKPLFLITNETDERLPHTGKLYVNYVITDGESYWVAATYCTAPYLTVDVEVWPSDRDRATVAEALENFHLED